MRLRAIIVEDEANSREILRNYLAKYCQNVDLQGEAESLDTALALIASTNPDLVFLDVEMPFGNAFDILDRMPERNFETVFVTAYNQYAVEALNTHAAYYLMKPIAIDELIRAVNYVAEIRAREDALADRVLRSVIPVAEGRITLPELSGFQVLQVAEILYCKADNNYTEIHLADRKYLASKTLKYFEETLRGFPFARIHKSFLVNVNEVVRYRRGKGGSIVLSNGKELMVSASGKKELLSYFE